MQSLHHLMHEFSQSKRHHLKALASAGLALALPKASGNQASAVVRIAAASDLKFALARVVKPFEVQTGIRVELNFGSSGNFARQIVQGLPVDIFMSADEDWAFKVADAGWTGAARDGAADRGVVYATGRLALIVPAASKLALDSALKGVQAQWPSVRKFAIANPEHAPYGRAAVQVLQSLGLWEAAKPKLVMGENIAQATQFVTTGAAQAGITAYPLAKDAQVAAVSKHLALPTELHAPLRQRMLLRKDASAAAVQLYGYLRSEAVLGQFEAAGFGAV
jgi:molybdate transport system substrate-binding protein